MELDTKADNSRNDGGDVNDANADDDDDDDDNKEEENNEEGILFYVNKEGFPMKEDSWLRMWNHAAKLFPCAANAISSLRKDARTTDGQVYYFTYFTETYLGNNKV